MFQLVSVEAGENSVNRDAEEITLVYTTTALPLAATTFDHHGKHAQHPTVASNWYVHLTARFKGRMPATIRSGFAPSLAMKGDDPSG